MIPTLAVPLLWRLAGYALLVAGIFGAGVYAEHGRMQKKLEAKTAEFERFKGAVAAIGAEAARRTALTDATNHRNKERTDEENRKRADTERRAIRRLRADADSARRSFTAQVGALTRRAETAEKFGANFDRAYRPLVDELRAIGDGGSAAVRNLDSAKDWAANRASP